MSHSLRHQLSTIAGHNKCFAVVNDAIVDTTFTLYLFPFFPFTAYFALKSSHYPQECSEFHLFRSLSLHLFFLSLSLSLSVQMSTNLPALEEHFFIYFHLFHPFIIQIQLSLEARIFSFLLQHGMNSSYLSFFNFSFLFLFAFASRILLPLFFVSFCLFSSDLFSVTSERHTMIYATPFAWTKADSPHTREKQGKKLSLSIHVSHAKQKETEREEMQERRRRRKLHHLFSLTYRGKKDEKYQLI